jgi:taurine dioxygenase
MRIVPTKGALGAEIHDVDIGRPLQSDAVERLREALRGHLVLVFRDQELTEREQVRFSRYFGDPRPHVRAQPDRPVEEIFVVSNVSENGRPIGALGNGELTFHSDLSYMPNPGSVSILYAVEIPKNGGDTQWANMYAAYDALPMKVRERLRPLRAVHRHGEEDQNPQIPVDHPIIRTHPETGRSALFVSPQFTRRIIGLPDEEGRMLLNELLRHVTREEFIWTHRWRPGDVVVWDNRCTMHRREPFDAAERRILRRTQMFGEAPYIER